MLNGQLQLTDTAFGAPMPRLRRPLYLAGAISLVVLAGCASRASAPRGRHGRRAADHRDGPAWRQLRRQAGRHALQDRAFEQRRRRERQALEQSQRSQPDFGGPGAQAVRWRRRDRRRDAGHAGGLGKSSSTQPRRLISRPTAAPRPRRHRPPRPPRRPRRPKNRRARPMPASSTGAGRPPARSPGLQQQHQGHRHRRQPGRPRHRGGRRQGHVQRQRRARPGQPDHRQPPERLHHGLRAQPRAAGQDRPGRQARRQDR